MIGVTLASPGFAELAEEARKRFMRHTGLQCVVVHTKSEKNYAAKLELPRMFNQTVVWFDADLWFIRDADLSQFDDREEFFGVRDPGIHDPDHFPFHDCQTLDLDLLKYFNTGFFIWNNRHQEAFKTAQRVMKSHAGKLRDFGEQSALNAGVQKHCKLALLSNTYNYMPFAEINHLRAMERLEKPHTIHAAGYGGELKASSLPFFEAKYLQTFDRR